MPLLLLLVSLIVFAVSGPVNAASNGDYIKMTSGGLERQYILVTPDEPKAAPLPLIVVIHGTVGNGRKMQEHLGFDKYANRYGFAVAYPDAYIEPGETKTTRWNDGRGTLASSELKVDDVAFLRDMIKHIGTRLKLDPARLFITGPSNGGMMTYRVACEAADLFAAAAPVIGNVPVPIVDRCLPSRPISILAINGTADPFVPFNGGTVCKNIGKFFCEGGEVVSSSRSLGIFARAAGCAAEPARQMLPSTAPEDPPVEYAAYGHCTSGKQIVAYHVQGGGHNWPPMAGQLGKRNGPPTKNLDATLTIVEFFLGKLSAQ